MTEVGVRFSVIDGPMRFVTTTTHARRHKSPTSSAAGNLFNHPHHHQQQRSHPMQYSAVLPIISLSTFADFKEKLIPMATNNRTFKQVTSSSSPLLQYRLKMPIAEAPASKTRSTIHNRPAASNTSKSSSSHSTRPNTPHRPNIHAYYQQQQQLQGASLLYIANTPISPRRTHSARIPLNPTLNPLPLHQQPHLISAPLLPRPHPQYNHFLAYLRRQSLARLRRRQEHDEGNNENVETTVIFNPIKPVSQPFQSTSNLSLGTSVPETSSMPSMSLSAKRKGRPLSSYRQLPRSSSTLTGPYRLTSNQSPTLRQSTPTTAVPHVATKKPTEDHSAPLASSSFLITPANSIVDETITSLKKAPYELQLAGDMLNYCYVSDSGMKYQGQLLSSAVWQKNVVLCLSFTLINKKKATRIYLKIFEKTELFDGARFAGVGGVSWEPWWLRAGDEALPVDEWKTLLVEEFIDDCESNFTSLADFCVRVAGSGGGCGIVAVVDVTFSASVNEVRKWMDEFDEEDEESEGIIMFAVIGRVAADDSSSIECAATIRSRSFRTSRTVRWNKCWTYS